MMLTYTNFPTTRMYTHASLVYPTLEKKKITACCEISNLQAPYNCAPNKLTCGPDLTTLHSREQHFSTPSSAHWTARNKALHEQQHISQHDSSSLKACISAKRPPILSSDLQTRNMKITASSSDHLRQPQANAFCLQKMMIREHHTTVRP
jgi:hypothetical protein